MVERIKASNKMFVYSINRENSICLNESLISIIIVSYASLPLLRLCIDSILKNTFYPCYEVIVVIPKAINNRNYILKVNELIERFKESYTNVKIKVIYTRDVGYSAANDIGLMYANGVYVAFLNADTIVMPNWLTEMYRAFKYFEKQGKPIGAVQSKLIMFKSNIEGKPLIDSVGHKVDEILNIWHEGFQEPAEKYNKPRLISVVQPAAMLTKKDIIRSVGYLFDPQYYILHEDTDFSLRLHRRGYFILLAPRSIVLHMRSPVLRRMHKLHFSFHSHKNALITILKNYDLRMLLKSIILRLLFGFISSTYKSLKFKRGEYVVGFVLSLVYILKNLSRIINHRRSLLRIFKVSSYSLLNHGIIERFNPIISYKRYIKYLRLYS